MKLRKIFLLPLISLSTLSVACSSTDPGLEKAQAYFQRNNIELSKNNAVTFLKKGYSFDKEEVINTVFASWKTTLLDYQLLEKPLDYSRFAKAFGVNKSKEDVTPNISAKGLYFDETYPGISGQIALVLGVKSQKVVNFQYSWKNNLDFKVQIHLKMTGIVGSDNTSTSLIKSFLASTSGVSESDFTGDKANFDGDVIFTYTPPTDNKRVSESTFSSIPASINFPFDIKIDMSTSHEKLNLLLSTNEQVKKIRTRTFKGKSIDLLPFFYYTLL
ncbi:lipoprotein [Mycoplasmoides genitalium]